jgi:copper oxidase (laccase) domain-containing protein
VSILAESEAVDEFAPFGIRAFTTTRASGSFGLASEEPAAQVMRRWRQLREELRPGGARLASATQVHGTKVVIHHAQWDGWLRVDEADGHASSDRGVALVVTVADCVPVFIAHPSGAAAILHSGWRGTASRIIEHGIGALAQRGFAIAELRVHLGPAICGKCYEVGSSPDETRQVRQPESISAPSSPTMHVPPAFGTSQRARSARVATTIASTHTALATSGGRSQ